MSLQSCCNDTDIPNKRAKREQLEFKIKTFQNICTSTVSTKNYSFETNLIELYFELNYFKNL